LPAPPQIHLLTRLPDSMDVFLAEISAGFGAVYGPAAGALYRESGRQIFSDLLLGGRVWVWGAGRHAEPEALLVARIAGTRGEVMFAHALAQASKDVCLALVRHATDELRAAGVASILAEFVPTDQRDWGTCFAACGYSVVAREVLGRDVDDALLDALEESGYLSLPHAPGSDAAMAACLVDAYQDHADRLLHEEVADLEKAAGLIERVLTGQAGASHADLVRAMGNGVRCDALALGAFAAPGVGFVIQIAVRRGLQGQGLGRRLLREMLAQFRRYGASRVMLGVSLDNPARGLYLDEGFEPVRAFTSHLWRRGA